MSKLELIKKDARERPFTYVLYFFQLVLAIALPLMIMDLDQSLNSRGCRFIVENTGKGVLP